MLSVPVDSEVKSLFHWHQVKVAHNNPQIPLFQFHRLLRHFEWTGCWVNGDFTLTHRFHTFLNFFLKCTGKKKKSLLTRFITLFRGFLAITKFVECFAHLMLSCLTSSINKKWSVGLLSFQITPCHPVIWTWWTAWSEVREREKERSAWKFCKRNIHLFVSALWRRLPFLPLSSSNSSHERLWVKVSCFEASSALVPFQSSLSWAHKH